MTSKSWSHRSLAERCQIVGRAAAEICKISDDLIDACRSGQRTDPVETITAELLPLCGALRYVKRRGRKILADRNCGAWGRPIWLWGATAKVSREPFGRVLILGTWNYPILLSGVQLAHALAGGNSVILKPAADCEEVTQLMASCFISAGVPETQIKVTNSSVDAAEQVISSGVDLIVLTGAAETGRKVLGAAAPHLSASIMELSGCDAAIILPGAKVKRVVESVEFGLKFNSGATCIGPRRLIVLQNHSADVIEALQKRLADASAMTIHPAARHGVKEAISRAIDDGANDGLAHFDPDTLSLSGLLKPIMLTDVSSDFPITSADLFAPVISVVTAKDVSDAVRIVNECPYRLAASVFGPTADARRVAEHLAVGSVTINDMVAPTADPRLPFGGRGDSGFGVTRGDEGLLAMTTPKVVSVRRGSLMPHLKKREARDEPILHGMMRMLYAGGVKNRFAGLRQMIRGVRR